MIQFHVDRDTEKTHGCRLSIGGKRGVSFGIQWRSWQSVLTPKGKAMYEADRNDWKAYEETYDPGMLRISIFVFGSFLGAKPFSDTWLGRRCCSNGVYLLNWTIWAPVED